MQNSLSKLIKDTIETEAANLKALNEQESLIPRGEGKWCPREELGHLLDSAANNQQRFVRAALDGVYVGPKYQQDDWVRLHGYRDVSWAELCGFWASYNRRLADLAERIPESKLNALCKMGDDPEVTLGFLIRDYVIHLQHHVDLILKRPIVTVYPEIPGI